MIVADEDGEILSVTGKQVVVRNSSGEQKVYTLRKYQRSNQSTCIDQRPAVTKGQYVKKGSIIADSSSTVGGELALGQNVVVAFVSWEGGNFEDAILISERLVQDDRFTSVHIEKYEVEARDTKLAPKRSPAIFPTWARMLSKTWTSTASSASAPKWARMTSWWVKSPPKVRKN